jgi:hypothetical protein
LDPEKGLDPDSLWFRNPDTRSRMKENKENEVDNFFYIFFLIFTTERHEIIYILLIKKFDKDHL